VRKRVAAGTETAHGASHPVKLIEDSVDRINLTTRWVVVLVSGES
jgi:hypothetical protein